MLLYIEINILASLVAENYFNSNYCTIHTKRKVALNYAVAKIATWRY
jgi:hypothetical protein